MAFCLSDGFIECVCGCLCLFVCVYAKVLITGLYKQVNWREKSNKVPCSSFNIPTTSSLHAALANVCARMCVLESLRGRVCISTFVCDSVFVWQ